MNTPMVHLDLTRTVMQHDDLHEKKQNAALELALSALVRHLDADDAVKNAQLIADLKDALAMLKSDDAA